MGLFSKLVSISPLSERYINNSNYDKSYYPLMLRNWWKNPGKHLLFGKHKYSQRDFLGIHITP